MSATDPNTQSALVWCGLPLQMVAELDRPNNQRIGWETNADLMVAARQLCAADNRIRELEALSAHPPADTGEAVAWFTREDEYDRPARWVEITEGEVAWFRDKGRDVCQLYAAPVAGRGDREAVVADFEAAIMAYWPVDASLSASELSNRISRLDAARAAVLALSAPTSVAGVEISDAALLEAVMNATEEIADAEDDYWKQSTLDSVAEARANPTSEATLAALKPARILLKHINAALASTAPPPQGDLAPVCSCVVDGQCRAGCSICGGTGRANFHAENQAAPQGDLAVAIEGLLSGIVRMGEASNAAMKDDDEPAKVRLSDGTLVEGEIAETVWELADALRLCGTLAAEALRTLTGEKG